MKKITFICTAILAAGVFSLQAQDHRFVEENPTKPDKTEFWDPEIRVVSPGKTPSDAIILFDGKSLDNWETVKDGSPAKWKVEDGAMTVVKGAGNISTKQKFTNYQLHIEWRSPMEPETLKSQGKGNSGIFMQGMYEVQVLNSYQNRSYRNGQAGSIYKQSAPLVNATSPMGEWNSYDIIYTAPKFTINGGIDTPAYVTVIHNGIVVQNHTKIQGTTEYIGQPKNPVHGPGPISLQDHGNPVSFRNIWIREM
ncbi:3-keto-disaccharide hydrolase [Aquirufa ecclesiirivi]